jgi:hypothetical protein
MSEFPLHPNSPELVTVESEELQLLRDRISKTEAESKQHLDWAATWHDALCIVATVLEVPTCDSEPMIKTGIVETIRDLQAENQRLRCEAQALRSANARSNLYLCIAKDCLDPNDKGGPIACDYEHEIHEPIRELVRENERLRAEVAAQVETICAKIKEADDESCKGDYMLDSDDCIKVIRGKWGVKNAPGEK